jgi:tetratricopeptide (TPR) repeat protein
MKKKKQILAKKGVPQGLFHKLVLQLSVTQLAVVASGDHLSAAVLEDEMLDLARREGSATSLWLAHRAQLIGHFFRGDLVGVEEHFAVLNSLFDAAGLRQFPRAAVVTARSFASWAAWMLGHADLAHERMARAIAFARDANDPFDLALGRYHESVLYLFLREPVVADAAATRALASSEEHGFSSIADAARTIMGWACAQLGNAGEGVSLLRKGIEGLAKIGEKVAMTAHLTRLAEAQGLDGKLDDALNTIDQALRANPEERVFRPAALICRGELRLKTRQAELAEGDFREALVLARKMSAKTIELHATVSLAQRMLARQDTRLEARAMLADLYNWFREGFHTSALKEAEVLLDQLSNPVDSRRIPDEARALEGHQKKSLPPHKRSS